MNCPNPKPIFKVDQEQRGIDLSGRKLPNGTWERAVARVRIVTVPLLGKIK